MLREGTARGPDSECLPTRHLLDSAYSGFLSMLCVQHLGSGAQGLCITWKLGLCLGSPPRCQALLRCTAEWSCQGD